MICLSHETINKKRALEKKNLVCHYFEFSSKQDNGIEFENALLWIYLGFEFRLQGTRKRPFQSIEILIKVDIPNSESNILIKIKVLWQLKVIH